jgi:acetate---CoA ligase (ADP-forming)
MRNFLSPKGIAIVGASPDFARPGGRALSYLVNNGYAGGIYPVNPRYPVIGNLTCYRSVEDVPDPLDLALICVAPAAVSDCLRDCGSRGIGLAIVHADGFGRPGDELHDALMFAIRESGVRVIGPNTNGVRIAHLGALVETGMAVASLGFRDGPCALIGQSGGLSTYFGATYLQHRGGGARYVVDVGNECDVDIADVLDLVIADPAVRAVGIILEGCRQGRKLSRGIERARERECLIFLLRVGRSAAALEAAVSHTGNLAGHVEVFDQLMTAAGAVICQWPKDLTHAMLLAGAGIAPGRGGCGVVTASGGFGVLALDLAGAYGVDVPVPAAEPPVGLFEELGEAARRNPIDISAQFRPSTDVLSGAVSFLLGQAGIQVVLIWQPHQLADAVRSRKLVMALQTLKARTDKCIAVCGLLDPAIWEEFDQAGILAFETPEDFFAALALATGQQRPAHRVLGGQTGRLSLAPSGQDARGRGAVITGMSAQEALTRSGVAFAPTSVVRNASEASQFARDNGAPIVLKVDVPGVAHKSELGLVSGVLRTEVEIVSAYEALASKAVGATGAVVIAQVYVRGVEMVLGALQDPTFGPVVMVGAGGTLVEFMNDVAFAAAPVTQQQAGDLIDRLKSAVLLRGYRGGAAADIPALLRSVVAVSEASTDEGAGIAEVEINPVIVGAAGQGALGVDALIVPR